MKLRKVRNSLEHRGSFTPASGIRGENLSTVFSAAAFAVEGCPGVSDFLDSRE